MCLSHCNKCMLPVFRYDMPFPYPEGDSNPVAMISMLKSTLARMEDNLTG